MLLAHVLIFTTYTCVYGGRPSFGAILRAAKAQCENCRTSDNLTLNHKTPIAMGGTNEWQNLQILCRGCHDGYHGTTKSLKKMR